MRRSGKALTFGPMTASSAGSATSEKSTASRTAATPPYDIDFRNVDGKRVRPASAAATVVPETITVRPAVARVRPIAASPV